MLWEEYYDKIYDWTTSTAVNRISKLENFGPPDEIIDALHTIGFYDKKGATRLLKKAVAAGVKFTGDQLSELYQLCDETVIDLAIETSSDQFKTKDLDALYGFCDEERLIGIAKKQNIVLPECLAELGDAFTFDPEDPEEPPMTPEELAGEYDYILSCLKHARELLKKAEEVLNAL